jgi:hypothetical protein
MIDLYIVVRIAELPPKKYYVFEKKLEALEFAEIGDHVIKVPAETQESIGTAKKVFG